VVSPEDDIELRRAHHQPLAQRREIEVTSYAEVVLAPRPPTRCIRPSATCSCRPRSCAAQAILCTRRPRSRRRAAPWMLHLMAVHGAEVGDAVSYETDRSASSAAAAPPRRRRRWTGRRAVRQRGLGARSDRRHPLPLVLEPEQSATVDMVTGIGRNPRHGAGLVDKYQDRHLADRVFELAWTHSQVVLRQLNASEADAQLYARLAGSVIYANAALRADAAC
jgi:cyclic beta-1,2-glucan synthetase